MTLLAIVFLIAGVIFYNLANISLIIKGAVLAISFLLAIIAVLNTVMGHVFIKFVKDSVRETKKVVWPTRKEAIQITMIVFGFVLIMALFLWGLDKLLEFLLYDVILSWKNNG